MPTKATGHLAEQADDIAHRDDLVALGFWTYLMTDCILFASFFAVYAVLTHSTFGGPSGHDIFRLPYVLKETFILLTSSFTCGLAMLAAHRGDKRQTFAWFGITLALGLTFLFMEVSEFHNLIQAGNGPQRSGFLSSYFSLVGLHGLHIAVGSIWMIVALVHLQLKGLTPGTVRKLTTLSLFWHFLDIVWIFIFSIVYLLGATS
jgi:cytochrome o ubiquinol oxidase subunit 3